MHGRHPDGSLADDPLSDGPDLPPADAFALPPPSPGFEERLLRTTTVVVRSRARRRRLVLFAGLGLAYAAGALTVASVRSWGGEEAGGAAPPVAMAPSAFPPSPSLADPDALADDLRRRGDRFLAEEGDVASALACYRQHLELLSVRGTPRPASDDTWLLAALKQDLR